MRSFRFVLLLAGALTFGGCFQLSSVITVKGDGTGTIQQRLLFTSAALAQIRGFAAFGGGRGQSFDPVSEQQARAAAASLGPGVTYVSSTPIKTSEGQGRDITYAFTDVSQLHIAQAPPAPGGLSIGGSAMPAASFQLTRQPDGNALLRIIVPRPSTSGSDPASPGGPNQLPFDQLAMFKQTLAGARLSIAVEPAGSLIRTSSPYVDGSRVTLIDINLDELLKDDSLLPRLQAAQTADEAKAVLKDAPGVKVNLDPEITIEFAPAK